MDSLRGIQPYGAVHLPSALRDAMQTGTGDTGLPSFTRAVRTLAHAMGCSVDDAVDVMFDRSIADGCSLGHVALAVVEGRIRFDS